MSIKSMTCKSKSTGKPLSQFWTEQEANFNADLVKQQYGRKMVSYRCESCERWHLSPRDRHTPNTICRYCTGHDGRPKCLYKSEEGAQKRADISSVSLKVYQCPYGVGWHLTSSRRHRY